MKNCKKMLLCTLLSLLILVCYAVPATAGSSTYNPPGNLLGSSTLDATQWSSKNLLHIIKNGEPHSGSNGLNMMVISSFAFKATEFYSLYRTVTLPKTSMYEAVIYVKDVTGNAFLKVNERKVSAVKSSGWQVLRLRFSGTQGDTVRICFGADALGTYQFDDASLAPVYTGALPMPIENGDFESQLNGWLQRGSGSIFTTSDQAYAGQSAASFSYFTSEPMQNYLEQRVKADASQYVLTAMLMTAPSFTGRAELRLEALNAAGKVLHTESAGISGPSGGWTQVRVPFTAPEGTESLRMKLGGAYCTGLFYADTIQMQRYF